MSKFKPGIYVTTKTLSRHGEPLSVVLTGTQLLVAAENQKEDREFVEHDWIRRDYLMNYWGCVPAHAVWNEEPRCENLTKSPRGVLRCTLPPGHDSDPLSLHTIDFDDLKEDSRA